jgi:DNA-binding NtrC family response regulator
LDFLDKPLSSERVIVTLQNALKQSELRSENRELKLAMESKYEIVGQSPALRRVLEAVQRAAPTNATVMLLGESGVGKELVARTIHRNSPRAGQRFVQVNCAAIPEELIESELFGHEKGSFTGATEKQIGKFEQADRGTIFLDEVGDMSPKTQAKVLRVLQEQEVERLGSARTIKVDCARDCRDQQGPRRGDSTRRIPRGPVFPTQRDSPSSCRRCASARGHSAARPPLREADGRRTQSQGEEVRAGRAMEMLAALPLARATSANCATPSSVYLIMSPAEISSALTICRRKSGGGDQRCGTAGNGHAPTDRRVQSQRRRLPRTVRRVRSASSKMPPSARIWYRSFARHNWNISKTADSDRYAASNLYKKLEQYGIKARGRRLERQNSPLPTSNSQTALAPAANGFASL